MRIWGRNFNPNGTYSWAAVVPDANGHPDYVYVTQMIQVLKLVLGESPFYANYGIPAHQSIVTQVFPDFYVNQVQRQFAPFFASLTIEKVNLPDPTYNVFVTTMQGVPINISIPV